MHSHGEREVPVQTVNGPHVAYGRHGSTGCT
uniref:Uncharacterized protein n=1 Tax=Arundo donax TaxID=35708 RepID=A0A0A9C2K3_ARUDO